MIVWTAGELYAYYADDRNRTVGEFWIDHSARPRMWRLRHLIRGTSECSVIRIGKVERRGAFSGVAGKQYEDVRKMMLDGIESTAKLIGLRPRGKLRQLKLADAFKTSMVE